MSRARTTKPRPAAPCRRWRRDGADPAGAQGQPAFHPAAPRYTEATLIKTLEENGIGRPSTYAPTIGTILAREYVEREGKALKPTALGEVTTGLMEEQFPEIVDVDFTANMERQLDGVESGKADWVQTLDHFYDGFSKTLQKAEEATSGGADQGPRGGK